MKTLQPGDIILDDTEHPVSECVQKILSSGGIDQVVTTLLNTLEVINAVITKTNDPKLVTDVEMPKIIMQLFPDLDMNEVSTVNGVTKTQLAMHANGGLLSKLAPKFEVVGSTPEKQKNDDDRNGIPNGAKEFLNIGNKFIDIDNFNIDLIDSINPFQGTYEILSKSVNATLLKTIQIHIWDKVLSPYHERRGLLILILMSNSAS